MFGSYRVTDKLGVGGTGVVYEAEHVNIGRKAAIKVLRPEWSENSVQVERFFNEARSSARIQHPGIVEIFDCGFTDDGQAYLVMELLGGEPLHIVLARERQLTVRRATDLIRQMASALAAAHEQGIIHRDLKPDNVFVIPDRHALTKESIKVLDFGIAKLADQGEQIHGLLGTPLYMPPEQVTSSAAVDRRSDIYALGCMLFEMLCGQPPFTHDDPYVVATMQVENPPPAVSELRPDVPFNVVTLIARMLAKEPDSRPQSMADLRAELDVAWGLMESAAGDQPAAPALGPEVIRVSARALADVAPAVRAESSSDALADAASSRRGGRTGRRRALVAALALAALAAVGLGIALAASL